MIRDETVYVGDNRALSDKLIRTVLSLPEIILSEMIDSIKRFA
jgi:hypothetical protein